MMELAVTHLHMGKQPLKWPEVGGEQMRTDWGTQRLETLRALSHLAEALRLGGELERARKWQELVLSNLPEALAEEKKYQAMLPERQRRGWMDQRLDETLDLFEAKGNLARTLKELEKVECLQEAYRIEWQVWQARRRELGRKHLDTMQTFANLAETVRRQGRHRRARRMLPSPLPFFTTARTR